MTTTLGSSRSNDSLVRDGRLISLSKLLQTVPNSPTHTPNSPLSQTAISFHNFHLNVPLSKTGSNFFPKGSASPKFNEFFNEMSSTHPKLSPRAKQSHFARTFSNTLQSEKGNQTAYNFYATSKSLKFPTFGKVKSSPSAQYNKTVSDYPMKTGFDMSYTNQLTEKVEATYSMLNASKKLGLTDTFQPKKKMIDQDTLKAYRMLINSKDHGKLHEAVPKKEKPPVFISVRARNNTSKAKERSKTLEAERDEALQRTVQEEAKFVDDLKEKGLIEFHRKVTMNNFIKGKYLVEPEDGDFKEVRANMRKLQTSSKTDKEHKQEFWDHFSRHLSVEDNLASSVRKQKPDRSMKSRKGGRFLKTIESNMHVSTEGDSMVKASSNNEKDLRKKEEASKQNVEKMKSLRRMLSKDKIMSENEQLIFKLVKIGNESDLGYLLSRFNDLIRAQDTRMETPLHWAAKRGNLSIVQCLLRNGADIDALDMANRRPIDLAERLKKEEVAEYLRRLHYKKEADHRFGAREMTRNLDNF